MLPPASPSTTPASRQLRDRGPEVPRHLLLSAIPHLPGARGAVRELPATRSSSCAGDAGASGRVDVRSPASPAKHLQPGGSHHPGRPGWRRTASHRRVLQPSAGAGTRSSRRWSSGGNPAAADSDDDGGRPSGISCPSSPPVLRRQRNRSASCWVGHDHGTLFTLFVVPSIYIPVAAHAPRRGDLRGNPPAPPRTRLPVSSPARPGARLAGRVGGRRRGRRSAGFRSGNHGAPRRGAAASAVGEDRAPPAQLWTRTSSRYQPLRDTEVSPLPSREAEAHGLSGRRRRCRSSASSPGVAAPGLQSRERDCCRGRSPRRCRIGPAAASWSGWVGVLPLLVETPNRLCRSAAAPLAPRPVVPELMVNGPARWGMTAGETSRWSETAPEIIAQMETSGVERPTSRCRRRRCGPAAAAAASKPNS